MISLEAGGSFVLTPGSYVLAPASYVLVSGPVSSSTPVPSTTVPPASTLPQGAGSVITIVGGPNVTVALPGPQDDAADLFGIIPVMLGIGAAIAGARWLFGRSGGKPAAPESLPSASDPTPTGREAPR